MACGHGCDEKDKRNSPKKALVVHGYGLSGGGLGANGLVLERAADLFHSGLYQYLVLPAGVNEHTGEKKPLIWKLHWDYLQKQLIFGTEMLFPGMFSPSGMSAVADYVASDTATEVTIASQLCAAHGIYFVDAVGVWPHSHKIARCWKLVGRPVHLERMHHVFSSHPRVLLENMISFGVGLFDPLGEYWPAKQIKQRRCDLYTPAHLKNRVIF